MTGRPECDHGVHEPSAALVGNSSEDRRLALHQEHLILDWSSRVPVERAQLPPDPRIRLERVDGEQRWNLCRAYNLATRLAQGQLLLKLDADCWPDQFDPELLNRLDTGVCRFGSGPDGRLGQFLMHRDAFEAVGGFNEVLLGYGFDDKDLKARLASLGFQLHGLPVDAIGVIALHPNVSVDHVAEPRTSPMRSPSALLSGGPPP